MSKETTQNQDKEHENMNNCRFEKEKTDPMEDLRKAEKKMKEAGDAFVEGLNVESDKLEAACNKVEELREVMLEVSGRLGVERRARQKLERTMYTMLIQGMYHSEQNAQSINRILGVDASVTTFVPDEDSWDDSSETQRLLDHYYGNAAELDERRHVGAKRLMNAIHGTGPEFSDDRVKHICEFEKEIAGFAENMRCIKNAALDGEYDEESFPKVAAKIEDFIDLLVAIHDDLGKAITEPEEK